MRKADERSTNDQMLELDFYAKPQVDHFLHADVLPIYLEIV